MRKGHSRFRNCQNDKHFSNSWLHIVENDNLNNDDNGGVDDDSKNDDDEDVDDNDHNDHDEQIFFTFLAAA